MSAAAGPGEARARALRANAIVSGERMQRQSTRKRSSLTAGGPESARVPPVQRRLDIGGVLKTAFETYTAQATLLIPAALLLFLPVAIVTGLILSGDAGLLSLVLVQLVTALATVFFQGMVVEAARDMLDGRRDETIGGLFRAALPVLVPLLVAGLIVSIATAFGLLLLIVGAVLVATIFAVVAPVVVVERTGAIDALKRSIALVKPYFLQVLGVVVVVFIINFVISLLLRAIFSGIDDSAFGFAAATLVTQAITAPIAALAAAALYFQLKQLHGEPVDGTQPQGTAAAVPPPAV